MAKKFNAEAYRNECEKNLKDLEHDLKIAEQNLKDAYKEAGDNWTIDTYKKVIKPYSDIEKQIKDKIAYYHIELIEKKYVSEYLWSDVHAYEVLEVINENKYVIRRLKATITENAKKELQESFVPGGFCGHFDNSRQEWTFASDETAEPIILKRTKKGRWHPQGVRPSSIRWRVLDHPYEHYDYNF